MCTPAPNKHQRSRRPRARSTSPSNGPAWWTSKSMTQAWSSRSSRCIDHDGVRPRHRRGAGPADSRGVREPGSRGAGGPGGLVPRADPGLAGASLRRIRRRTTDPVEPRQVHRLSGSAWVLRALGPVMAGYIAWRHSRTGPARQPHVRCRLRVAVGGDCAGIVAAGRVWKVVIPARSVSLIQSRAMGVNPAHGTISRPGWVGYAPAARRWRWQVAAPRARRCSPASTSPPVRPRPTSVSPRARCRRPTRARSPRRPPERRSPPSSR